MKENLDPRRLDEFFADVRGGSEQSFLAKYTTPFLVYVPGGAGGQGHETISLNQGDILAAEHPLARGAPICKTPRNPFEGQIYVGRARNNDIVLSDGSVSKTHAFFSRDPAGAWQVTDMGSSNGTTIAGKRLAANAPVTLIDGQRVVFGRLPTTFYLPIGFYTYIKTAAGLQTRP